MAQMKIEAPPSASYKTVGALGPGDVFRWKGSLYLKRACLTAAIRLPDARETAFSRDCLVEAVKATLRWEPLT